jgi:hypothetical protein
MRRLGKYAPALEQKAELPRCASARARLLIDDDSIEQPAPAHLLDEWRAQCAHAVAELLAQPLRALREPLVNQNVQCGHRHCAAERVPITRDEHEKWVIIMIKKGCAPAVCAAVLAGPDAQHHLLVCEHGRHGVHATGEGLSEKNDVRSDALVLYAQQFARSRKALSDRTCLASSSSGHWGAPHRLDLIADEQDVMLRAKRADLAKVSLWRDDDPCFTLDGLDEESSDVLAMELERSSDVSNFTISDGANCIAVMVRWTHACKVRAETISTFRVCAHAGIRL